VRLTASGTLKSYSVIAPGNGFPESIRALGRLGLDVEAIGDLDNDGNVDLAIGSTVDANTTAYGHVWITFMHANMTVKGTQLITEGTGMLGLERSDGFGQALSYLGDANGDGVGGILVSSAFFDDGGSRKKALWILFLNADGTVAAFSRIFEGPASGRHTVRVLQRARSNIVRSVVRARHECSDRVLAHRSADLSRNLHWRCLACHGLDRL
jgi:hypothetical protein